MRSDSTDSAAAEEESRRSSNADDEFDVQNNVISSESTPEAENRCLNVIVDDPEHVSDTGLSVTEDEVKADHNAPLIDQVETDIKKIDAREDLRESDPKSNRNSNKKQDKRNGKDENSGKRQRTGKGFFCCRV